MGLSLSLPEAEGSVSRCLRDYVLAYGSTKLCLVLRGHHEMA